MYVHIYIHIYIHTINMYIYTYIDIYIYILIIFVCVYTYVYIRMYNMSTNIKSFSHCNPTCISSIYIYILNVILPSSNGLIRRHLTIRLNAMLQAEELPAPEQKSEFWRMEALPLHREAFTQELLHTRAFTDRNFYAKKSLHRELLHTEAFTHRSFYTEKSLHREAFTRRSFFTQKFFTHP